VDHNGPKRFMGQGRTAKGIESTDKSETVDLSTGLPDFSWSKIPKRGENIPNYHKI
jgi:hypothetical protein